MPEKQTVALSSQQRQKLLRIIRTGKRSSRVVLRARILIKSAKGWTDEQIADALETSPATVRRTRLHRRAEGVIRALVEKPRSGAPHKLTLEDEARLVALACSKPPAGRCRWTIQLLAQLAVERNLIVRVAPETVRGVLKKNKVKPWQVESWCRANVTPAFLRCLKDVLTLYAQPYDPHRPTVCFDEKSLQLLADYRPGGSLKSGHPLRQDYEYVRHGTRNIFVFAEPKAGQRKILVTRQRKKEDFAKALRYLVDCVYPTALMIDLVTDNLNTHTSEVIIEIFGKQEADRILSRIAFHYTPLHASWVNIAEMEFSAMTLQCLDRRIPDEWTLYLELLAWETARNQRARPIQWSFNWKCAKRMFLDKKDITDD